MFIGFVSKQPLFLLNTALLHGWYFTFLKNSAPKLCRAWFSDLKKGVLHNKSLVLIKSYRTVLISRIKFLEKPIMNDSFIFTYIAQLSLWDLSTWAII